LGFGVRSEPRTRYELGLLELRFVAQTFTVPVDSPPVTVAVNVWLALASIVSMTVL
jgi:hypothetical protein